MPSKLSQTKEDYIQEDSIYLKSIYKDRKEISVGLGMGGW